MNSTARWMRRDGAPVKEYSSNAVSLVCLIGLALFFYIASILVGWADEPVNSLANVRAVSAAPTSSGGQPHESWFRRMFHKPTWSELLEKCQSPRDVCSLVNRFVGYRTEEVDRWAPATETWTNGRGDCEDFAVLIETLCNQLGFGQSTVNLYFLSGLRDEGHAVVVGTWEGKMWMSSNGSYEEVQSIDEVKKTVARMYGCSKNEMWGMVLAHKDVERRLQVASGPVVGAPIGP